MRLLHGAARRRACPLLLDARGPGGGSRGDDRRGTRPRSSSASPGAAGVSRMSWPAVRVLHARIRDVGRGAPGAAPEANSAADRRRHRGQPVPLHRLRINQESGHPGRRTLFPACGEVRPEGPGWGGMTTRWFGAPVQRVEDDRLLRGHGRFTDDISEGALECCFVRSPYARARIRSIDASAARRAPGVVAVYTAADLPFGGLDLP